MRWFNQVSKITDRTNEMSSEIRNNEFCILRHFIRNLTVSKFFTLALLSYKIVIRLSKTLIYVQSEITLHTADLYRY